MAAGATAERDTGRTILVETTRLLDRGAWCAAARLLERSAGLLWASGVTATLLRTLANRHRLQVLCALSDGELAVGEINGRVRLSQSALSQHLAVLRAEGLVATRRAAQTIYYRMVPGPALEVMRVVQGIFCPAPARMSHRRKATA